ncbi:MAG TPA: pyridoxamine 5'-phosphate oxidase family protein [Amycolatopsis sp.]|nr:pyridoxamine 5'-phosphate oxidase family protein [Amycolatopsis sp.]
MAGFPDGTYKMFLFVRRPDGSPMGYPMTAMVRGGTVEFTTYRKAAKARYLLADDRVCCVVIDNDDPRRATVVSGRARPVDGSTFAEATRAGEARRPVPQSVRDDVRDRLRTGKRVAFRVTDDETRPPRRVEVAQCRSSPIRPQSRLSGLRSNGFALFQVCLLLVGLVTRAER